MSTSLPQDWAFNAEHTSLVPSGRLNSGEGTLVDWACTVALTPLGGLPADGSFGAGLGPAIAANVSAAQIGEQLRGDLYQDDRVAEVSTQGSTQAGALSLPVQIEASTGPYRLAGALTADLIEAIIEDRGL